MITLLFLFLVVLGVGYFVPSFAAHVMPYFYIVGGILIVIFIIIPLLKMIFKKK